MIYQTSKNGKPFSDIPVQTAQTGNVSPFPVSCKYFTFDARYIKVLSYVYMCRMYKANEKFSGKGHTAHICKKCAALPPDVRSAQMIENKLLSLPWRLSKEQIKWLNNKAHDKRPEIRKLAQEQLDMRFHPERLASDDADEFEDLLLNKDDEDEDEW